VKVADAELTVHWMTVTLPEFSGSMHATNAALLQRIPFLRGDRPMNAVAGVKREIPG